MDHTICHFEVPVDDIERAETFYRHLFGWDVQRYGGSETPMSMITTIPTDGQGVPIRPGVNGMLIQRQHPQHPFANYVNVESVEEYGKKIESLGGRIVMPKTPVPGMGYFLYFQDTEGNIMGLWEHDPSAAPAA